MARIATAVTINALAASFAGCGGLPVTPDSVSERGAANAIRWSETSLHSFNYTDGADNTYAGLIFDAAGNLYGTTQHGGTYGCNLVESCGIAFELVHGAHGKWTEKVLHSFSAYDSLGFSPRAGFVIDSKGNLYGTTDAGGRFCYGSVSCGTVYELSRSKGSWIAKVIYGFRGTSDGSNPQAALTFDAAGNLYGTTSEGGDNDNGTIFELAPKSGGYWTKTILHTFSTGEGEGPASKLAFDSAGNLYGTTGFGGAYGSGCGGIGCGTAFRLKPSGSGTWTLKVLHSFGQGSDGAFPVSALTVDSVGNLFGVTSQGGQHESGCFAYGCGTVYELSRAKAGKWTERILHNFGSGTDGNLPRGDLIFDGSGALYGTTVFGGLYGAGNAFRLVPHGNGTWKEEALHNFGKHKDGDLPYSGMIFDKAYNLYGTTAGGGRYRTGDCQKSHGCGTVFEIAR